jgi:hypothetical protein
MTYLMESKMGATYPLALISCFLSLIVANSPEILTYKIFLCLLPRVKITDYEADGSF